MGREVGERDVAALTEAVDLDVGPRQVRLEVGLVGRDDGRPARRQRLDQLRLRLRDALDRAEELEVDGADRRDDPHVRPRDLAELGDLPEAAHAHLDDRDLGVRLELAERQRKADLVVLASLGRHGARVRPAKRGEDVLGRGLRGRARDGDDLRTAPRADLARDRRRGR